MEHKLNVCRPRRVPPRALSSSSRRRCRTRRGLGPPAFERCTPNARAAISTSRVTSAWLGLAGFERTATLRRLGTASLSSSSALPKVSSADGEGRSRDVAAWTREAGNETEPNRVANIDHDDGDRRGRFPGRRRRRRRRRDDDGHLEPDQLGGEVGQPVKIALRKPILDNDVLALDMAEISQTPTKGVEVLPRLKGCRASRGRDSRSAPPFLFAAARVLRGATLPPRRAPR